MLKEIFNKNHLQLLMTSSLIFLDLSVALWRKAVKINVAKDHWARETKEKRKKARFSLSRFKPWNVKWEEERRKNIVESSWATLCAIIQYYGITTKLNEFSWSFFSLLRSWSFSLMLRTLSWWSCCYKLCNRTRGNAIFDVLKDTNQFISWLSFKL